MDPFAGIGPIGYRGTGMSAVAVCRHVIQELSLDKGARCDALTLPPHLYELQARIGLVEDVGKVLLGAFTSIMQDHHLHVEVSDMGRQQYALVCNAQCSSPDEFLV